MPQTIIFRFTKTEQFDAKLKQIRWFDDTNTRWTGLFPKLSIGDYGLFIGQGVLYIGELAEVNTQTSLLFKNIKVFQISNGDFLRLNSVTPENISTVMAQFHPFITVNPIDIEELVFEITNKKLVSFFIYDEAKSDLSRIILRDNDRVVRAFKLVPKFLQQVKEGGLTTFRNFKADLFGSKDSSLEELKKLHKEKGKKRNVQIIEKIEKSLKEIGHYQFRSFKEYYNVIHNKKLYRGIIDENEIEDSEIEDITETSVNSTRRDFTISENNDPAIGVNELASTMANLLKRLQETDKGKMVGVFGKWGRGKTFLVDKIWDILEDDDAKPFLRIDFHAWKYQDTPASWAYLYESFAKTYFRASEHLDCVNKELDGLHKLATLNYKRLGWKPIVLLFITVLFSIIGFNFAKESAETIKFFVGLTGFSLISLQIFSVFKRSFSKEAKDVFKKYYAKKSYSNLLGVQAEIQNDLRILLKTWIPENEKKEINKRILLFVDDIDRCSEDRIMAIIDALRVMLEDHEISRRVIVLAAIDERVLKRAIKWKYHDLLTKDFETDINSNKELSRTITSEYMDKLFLSGVSLGYLTENERREVLSKYIKGRVRRIKEITPISDETNNNVSNNRDEQKQSSVEQPQETSNSSEEPAYFIENDEYDLTETEETFLSDLMSFNDSATPRQIRIFYYRYLLARNILIDRMALTEISEDQRLNLAKLLMHYTITNDSSKIGTYKNIYAKSKAETTPVNILNETFEVNTKELLVLYEVLEIVIAY